MDIYLEKARQLYDLSDHELSRVSGHDCGRNLIYVCDRNGKSESVLRLSMSGDRKREDYLAEAEFVHYLAENHAPVADVIPSFNDNYVESFIQDEKEIFVVLFAYAKGMLISDNGYRYRDGALLEEYFYNTGKTLGAIHRLSKTYRPEHHRQDFFDRYNKDYIDALIPESYVQLKEAIERRLEEFKNLPMNKDDYGLVHFDFSDGNYHIDMESGEITVFDFDNCMYCWYMYDLANLWMHGTGWYRNELDALKRMESMNDYFETVLRGYRSETDISEKLLEQLPLSIDMVLIENIVDEFENASRKKEELNPEEIEHAAACLIRSIPYAGFGE